MQTIDLPSKTTALNETMATTKNAETQGDGDISPEKRAQDRTELLKFYDVDYRKGKPYLIMKAGNRGEDMPWKDVLISTFAAVCICGFAAFCYIFEHPTYHEPGQEPLEFPFMLQQKRFFVDAHMHITFLVMACLFLPTIFKLRAIMTHRPAFHLQYILIVWNLIASGLSGWGMYYVVPDVIRMVEVWGVNGMLCHNESCYSGNKLAGLSIFIYQVTKFLEWIDTSLLALRKKPLSFLHLFHHIVTMVYCWHAAIYSSPADCSGIWFCGMNLVVHFIMYGYYGIMALEINFVKNFLRKFSFLLTILQTAQMVVGIYILGASIAFCNSWTENWHGCVFCAGMYGTYLILFGKLTYEKFKLCGAKRKKKKGA